MLLEWKVAKVIPLYKSGPRNSPGNGYVDISSFPRGSQCILGSLGGKQSFFRSRLL